VLSTGYWKLDWCFKAIIFS